jgi:transposase, IS5 family
MYKFKDNQLSLTDFGAAVGLKLNPENRWIRKSRSIPWEEIEQRYARLFINRKGNVAKPLRLALGACIIQAEYGFSDVETANMIQEHAYFQYFCGYREYDDSKPPFDPSLMVYFRKRLTPEILGEINEMIIAKAQARKVEESEQPKDDHDDDHPGGNRGTMIIDATCAPSNIKYPQDTALLNEARESAEDIIDALHTPGEAKPRTYRKQAHKDYMKYARSRKHTKSLVRKTIKKQLFYLARDLSHIDAMLSGGKEMGAKQAARLETLRKVYEQQRYMYDNQTHSVENRIISLSQPFLRPIVRGKVAKPVEFGAKLDISVCDGWTRLEVLSFDAYNEALNLQTMAERYRERTGHYPNRILADKIYRNRDNLVWCKLHHIRLTGPALGRPRKDAQRDKKQDYQDECERVEVERKFSLAKRKCGLGLIMTKLEETVSHSIAMSVVVLNLRKIQHPLLQALLVRLDGCGIKRKVVFVQ